MSEDLNAKLSRWSQRKLAARRGAEDVADDVRRYDDGQPAQEPAGPNPQAADAAPPGDEETPELPPIDELTAESDYTVFLGKNVPEQIKRAALRKLWLSDPVFANLDRLNDYDDDYSIVESVVSTVRTSYQVGKGYVDEVEEKLAKLEPANSDEATAAKPAESPDDSTAVERQTSPDHVGQSDATEEQLNTASRQIEATESGRASGGQAEDKG